MEDRIDSDHFSVVVWIRGNDGERRKRNGGERKRWGWTNEGKELFRKRMKDVWREERGR